MSVLAGFDLSVEIGPRLLKEAGAGGIGTPIDPPYDLGDGVNTVTVTTVDGQFLPAGPGKDWRAEITLTFECGQTPDSTSANGWDTGYTGKITLTVPLELVRDEQAGW